MSDFSDDFDFGGVRQLRDGTRTTVAPAGHRGVALPQAAAATAADSKTHFDVDQLLRILFKWKWLILGIVVACVSVAIAVTMMSTRIYRATATLEINVAPTEIMGGRGEVQGRMRNEDQFLQTQFGLLKSRSLAERVVKSLNLGADAGFVPPRKDPARAELAAIFKLMGHFEVRPVRGSNLVALSFTDVDPTRAARVVNGFAAAFIQSTMERRYNATAFARTFLQARLAATRTRLEASERELVRYAQRQGIVQLEQGGSNGGGGGRYAGNDGASGATGDTLSAQSLTALNGALSGAIGERIAAEQRYRQALANRTSNDVLQNPTVQALRGERARLEADYRERLQTFKPEFPEMLALRTRISQIDIELARESGDVASSLRSGYLAAVGREAQLNARVAGLRSNVLDLRNRGIGYNFLQRDVDTNRVLYDALLQRFKEIGVVGRLGESQAVVVDTALPPGAPFEPRPMRNLLIGLGTGLLLGFALAFAIEYIDDTIKSPEDAATKLKLSTLGLIPRMAKGSSLAVELADPKSDIAEAYYSVMTMLQFTTETGLPKSMLVTSTRAAEGKSSTSLALAQNLARVGASVLLIDGDLRKPSFKSSAPDTIGLSKLLITNQSVTAHVVPTGVARLSLLPSGAVPPNPAELLATNRIRQVIEEATEHFDVVIVDAPPVLGLADAPILSSICAVTLMVVEAGSARRAAVLNALGRLYAAEARVAGAIITKYNPKIVGYQYGYGYGYGTRKTRYGAEASATPMLEIGS